MLEIHAVSLPCAIVRLNLKLHGVTGSLYTMTAHGFLLTFVVSHSLDITLFVRDIIPLYAVTLLGIFTIVGATTKALAIDKQLNFISICIGEQRNCAAFFAVPVRRLSLNTNYHIIPQCAVFSIYYSNSH